LKHGQGSVVLDKRSNVWNFFFWDHGRRRSKKIGDKEQYPTKTLAWKAAKPLRDAVEAQEPIAPPPQKPAHQEALSVEALITLYRAERMPKRIATRRSAEVWVSNYVLPKWGKCLLTEVQPRPVQLWLESLPLSPKSKSHIRSVLRVLWDFAMFCGHVPISRNPMELVRIPGSSKRMRQPRNLTPAEYQQWLEKLPEPFRTIAIVCGCRGLRISECLALKWSDIDWLNRRLNIERGIVAGIVDDTKTECSRKPVDISPETIAALKTWKQITQFSAPDDWVFASPRTLGRLPWSADSVRRFFHKAAKVAGVADLGTHAMRHSFRSWLDMGGSSMTVQMKAMRHSSEAVTGKYGDADREVLRQAVDRVSVLALSKG
jgi:integrase